MKADAVIADDVRPSEPEDLVYWAWSVIANVGHKQGGWEVQDPEWVEAAERWRDAFHDAIKKATD